MKQIKAGKAPTNGKEGLAIGPNGDLIDAALSPMPRPASGRSGWIVGGLDLDPLPSKEERERRRWKRLNGGAPKPHE